MALLFSWLPSLTVSPVHVFAVPFSCFLMVALLERPRSPICLFSEIFIKRLVILNSDCLFNYIFIISICGTLKIFQVNGYYTRTYLEQKYPKSYYLPPFQGVYLLIHICYINLQTVLYFARAWIYLRGFIPTC